MISNLSIAIGAILLIFMFVISPILDKIEERQEYINTYLKNG